MLKRKICATALLGCVALFSSCEGLFEDVYDKLDKEANKSTYGFYNVNEANHTGAMYLNTSDYGQWVYVNLHNRTLDSCKIDTLDPMIEPEEWDFAVHRYDMKTNGGAALETQFSSINELLYTKQKIDGEFVEDVWCDTLFLDLTNMLSLDVKCFSSNYNAELSKWMSLKFSTWPPTGPPTFNTSEKVYLLRMKDNTYAALCVTDYYNASGDKGDLTIEYVYPYDYK
jgi:hypothetical protein